MTESLMGTLADWTKERPFIAVLLYAMVLDIITGIFCAVGIRKLNSTTSFHGMSKKAVILLIVGLGAVLEPYLEVPLQKLIATFYITTEAISVLENAAILGVPLPRALVEVVKDYREKTAKLGSIHVVLHKENKLEDKTK